MDGGGKAPSAHVLLLPFPAQGHLNPVLGFGKRLVAQGVRATIAITRFLARSTQPDVRSLHVVQISDGYDAGGLAEAESIQAYVESFRAAGSRTLAELLSGERDRGRPVKCVVYDSHLPWALDVAKEQGLLAAPFFTQACTVNAIYYHVYHGGLPVPFLGPTLSVDGLPELGLAELPSFVLGPPHHAVYLAILADQFSNLDRADTVFVNTFHQLESQVVDWMTGLFPTKTIGPTIPSLYLQESKDGDKHYGFDLFGTSGQTCNKWLDSQDAGSVIYVSFGTVATVDAEQMEELAWGITASGKPFLWVVRKSEEGKLPGEFTAESSEKGLVVPWCHQLEVLAHPAVGCFVTHCGWNSTLEALCLRVPMVALPQWTDQPTNAKFVEDVWGIGVRARAGEKGVVKREEIGLRITEVMEGARGEEIKENAAKWRKLAAEAVAEGGTSHRNVSEFVREVVGQSTK